MKHGGTETTEIEEVADASQESTPAEPTTLESCIRQSGQPNVADHSVIQR